MTWVAVADAGLPDGSLVGAEAGGVQLALARVDGDWHALDLWCTHEECPLTDGWLEGSAVRCSCHAALFELADGAPLEGPATDPVRVYATRVVDGRVEVELP